APTWNSAGVDIVLLGSGSVLVCGRSLPYRPGSTSDGRIASCRCRSIDEPLDQDGLLGLFDAKDTGGDYQLVPATDVDMRGKNAQPKESLEVIYDDA
ncbi:MAG: hypothetical protein NWR52_02195, partial [Paracoccaceae bacterium]|nr:hypothetical protein [Paracoccaceae bacterium]